MPEPRSWSRALARWAPDVAAAATLLAILVVPIYANPISARVFEAERIVVLRLLGTLALCASLPWLHRVRQLGTCGVAVLLYLLASMASAWLSDVPNTAFSGGYTKQAGLLTDLAFVGLFLGGVRLAIAGRVSLAIEVAVLGGATSALLAIAQSAGWQVPFDAGAGRATGLAGGPTVLGAHLAIVLPLALVPGPGGRARRFALIAILTAGMIASASRVALLAAAVSLLPLMAISRTRSRFLIGFGVAGALLAVTCWKPVRTALPRSALPQRVIDIFTSEQVETRMLLYREGLGAALHGSPRHALFGRGPDSIGPRFTASISPDLQRAIGGTTRIDRFHCDLIDLLYTRGVLAPLALLLIALSALRAGRREKHTAGSRDPPRSLTAAALRGAMLAALVDAMLAVPGGVSRVAFFAGAGCLVGLSLRESRTGHEATPVALRGLLTGTALTMILFAVTVPRYLWIAAPFALLLAPREARGRGLFVAAAVFLPFLVLHLGLVAANTTSDSVFSAAATAERARLDALVLLLALAAGAGLATRFLLVPTERAERTGDEATSSRPRLLAALLLAVVYGRLAVDDTLRILADINQRAASTAHHYAERPDVAFQLLDQAAGWAPEIARYRVRAALALADAARRDRRTAGSPERRLPELGRQVGLAIGKDKDDAYLLTSAARSLLLASLAVPDRSPGLLRVARDLSRDAVVRASTASNVLVNAGEIAIETGELEDAIEWLDRAISIDSSVGEALVLRGRAAAAASDLAGAAHFYSRSLATGVGRSEALLAVSLAAAARGNLTDAVTLLGRVADLVPPTGGDLELELRGARPLLTFVPAERLTELFARARRRYRGDPARLDRLDPPIRPRRRALPPPPMTSN